METRRWELAVYDLTESQKKALDLYVESTKQLLALSSGIVALTVTFLKDILRPAPPIAGWILVGSWIAYLFSLVCGIYALYALAGILSPLYAERRLPLRAPGVSLPIALQQAGFLFGTILVIGFGIVLVIAGPLPITDATARPAPTALPAPTDVPTATPLPASGP